jgi:hypothetical protein
MAYITIGSRVYLAIGCRRHFEWAVGYGGQQVVGEGLITSERVVSRLAFSRVGQALGRP